MRRLLTVGFRVPATLQVVAVSSASPRQAMIFDIGGCGASWCRHARGYACCSGLSQSEGRVLYEPRAALRRVEKQALGQALLVQQETPWSL